MTTVDYILIIIAVVIMVVGLYMIIRGILNRRKAASSQAIIRDKNGIPIIPRHERKLVEEPDHEEIEEGETVITPDREALQPVIHDNQSGHDGRFDYENAQESDSSTFLDDALKNNPSSQQYFELHSADADDYAEYETTNSVKSQQATGYSIPVAESRLTNNNESALEQKLTEEELALLQGEDHEDDVFSNLASATEKLMPVIETAQEPDFTDNSPMLDHHLLAEADQDQNSPLNHAQENINITIVPKNADELIDGKTVLDLVSQYGLKYGAMNMFHRYENKDGSGILWFSMMGINHEGITPFDLNVLPNSKYSGLVLFLSLPHPKATQGFDTMMSVVNLISNDLNAEILDENNKVLTRERRHQLRAQVQEYQSNTR